MGFWTDIGLLLKGQGSRPSFRAVDWLEAEGKWRGVQAMASSSNQADIKQALIQADILIDSIMKQAGVGGTTFGERLKSARALLPHDVYQKLWKAHLKRNELVHEHGSFVADWEKQTHLAAFEQAMSAMRGLK